MFIQVSPGRDNQTLVSGCCCGFSAPSRERLSIGAADISQGFGRGDLAVREAKQTCGGWVVCSGAGRRNRWQNVDFTWMTLMFVASSAERLFRRRLICESVSGKMITKPRLTSAFWTNPELTAVSLIDGSILFIKYLFFFFFLTHWANIRYI